MRTLALLALCAATSSSFLTTPQHKAIISNDQSRLEPEKYLCDLGAGDIRWVTEDEKWELKRVRVLMSSTGFGWAANLKSIEWPQLHGHYYRSLSQLEFAINVFQNTHLLP